MQKIWIFGTAIFLLILGILFAAGGPSAVRSIVKSELVLEPGTIAYDKWAVTPIPVYLNMYLFNWTNADQVREKGVKPNFDQVGPYVFSQRTSKANITFFANHTVSFRNKRVWTWEPELSNGTLQDLITAPHLPSLAAASFMRDQAYLIKVGFNTQLNSNGGALYQTHTASEWLFEGFEDRFLKYASNLPLLDIDLGPYKERFGWFYGRNGSESFEGTFTVNTGANDISKLGELLLWKGAPSTGYFEGDCGIINGSSSDIFPPGIDANKPITIFVMDTTRIINLYPTNKEVNVEGVKGRRYETTWDTFDNGQRNKAMKCYCAAKLQPDNCPPSGATSISGFASGVPMFLSHPNFLYAEPHYAETITGLRPDFERDIFSITMEPELSVPMEIQANVMVSLKIQRDDAITITRNIPEYFYAPMFVVSNKAALTADLAREVKLALYMPYVVRYLGYGFMAIGILLLVLGIILTKTNKWCGVNKHMTKKELIN